MNYDDCSLGGAVGLYAPLKTFIQDLRALEQACGQTIPKRIWQIETEQNGKRQLYAK